MERFRKPWSKRLGHFFDLKPRRRVHLDIRGTAVWTLMDGKRTVAEIGELMEARFGRDDMTYPRLAEFMRLLETNGLVVLHDEGGDPKKERGRTRAGSLRGTTSGREASGGQRPEKARERNGGDSLGSTAPRTEERAGGGWSGITGNGRSAGGHGSGSAGGTGGRRKGRSK